MAVARKERSVFRDPGFRYRFIRATRRANGETLPSHQLRIAPLPLPDELVFFHDLGVLAHGVRDRRPARVVSDLDDDSMISSCVIPICLELR